MKIGFKIILITPEEFLKNEISTLVALFDLGLTRLHVRKPKATKEQLATYINALPSASHEKIILHSHYELSEIYGIKGIHLTERARTSPTVLRKIKKKQIVSTGFHTASDLLKNRRKYEYIFLSPVFDSISKTGYKRNFNEKQLAELCKKRKNLVALGGINNRNIKRTKQLGFSGAALLGYIWQSDDPIALFKKLLREIE